MVVLGFVFGAVGFVTGAMAAHLPHLFELAGASTTAAIAVASRWDRPACSTPVRVRRIEAAASAGLDPHRSRPASARRGVAGIFGAPAAAGFAILHGGGNGFLTISRGTLPLALYGPVGYGRRTGIIVAPARVTTAVAPLLFGLLTNRFGLGALVVSGALGLTACRARLLAGTARAGPSAGRLAPLRHSRGRRSPRPHAVAAPSTGSAAPETNEASSEIRNSAALAISSGLPVRPIGFCRPRICTSASLSSPAVRC